MNHKTIVQILSLMVSCILLICSVSDSQEIEYDTILLEQKEPTKSGVRRMLDRTKTITEEALNSWADALSRATGEAITKKDLFLNVGKEAFDPLFDENDVFQDTISQNYLKKVSMIPEQTVQDWNYTLQYVTEDTSDFKITNTLLFVMTLDRLFTDTEFNHDESQKLLERFKFVTKDTVVKLAKALNQGDKKAAIRLVTLDSFFVNEVFQQEAFDQQLNKEMKE